MAILSQPLKLKELNLESYRVRAVKWLGAVCISFLQARVCVCVCGNGCFGSGDVVAFGCGLTVGV